MTDNQRPSVEREDSKGHSNYGGGTRRSSGSEPPPPPAHHLRPHYSDRFNIGKVEVVLQGTIQEFMRTRHAYSSEEAEGWTTDLSSTLNAKVKQFSFPRYKLVSFVTIGENTGGGVHMGMKTLWDSETDLFATYTYMSDTVFVVGVVCGVYYY